MSLIVVLAIALAVVLGYVTKINIGLFAIAFAYLLGCFGLDMKPGAVVDLWPLKIFFVIFSVCLFYSFALVNGTLEKLAEHMLYRCRNMPWVLPYAILLTATLIAAMGAGYYTVLAFMAPLTLILCRRTGLDMVLGAMGANYGALAGANFMSSQSGIIFRGLMTANGTSEADAFLYSGVIFAATLIIPFFVITAMLFLFGNHRSMTASLADAGRPAPLDGRQRTTLALTLGMMVLVLLGPVLQLALPGNATVAYLNGKIDIGLIAGVFSVIALLLKLGDERKAIASVPWSTLIMICGMGMLISVAIKAGTIAALAGWLGSSIPALLLPVVFGVVAAAMSLFSSTLGVVTPTLFPLVPALAAGLSVSPVLLFAAIVVGSQATSISPFSSGGSLVLGSAPDEATRSSLFTRLLFRAAPFGVVAAVAMNIVLTFVL
ncbi:di/tricarboxylate transporter [Azospirillum lipoferum]|uniref:SLC13 family permease n=1 Tax=Azospirillum lipoferum TaxID=193 RepID=A0A5A9GRJ7_AZOLI|nr:MULTISPECIES: SLC13 family permease [Azospirillum]KAA0596264.1 SLC13 family permease [Azospirillum lipoferum]MCP1611232.1 di/tricarboxylate transporter [Azospirillum lipoferum]MDW5533643.1 SLC13 family permease [Azospirillum sp. NL1]